MTVNEVIAQKKETEKKIRDLLESLSESSGMEIENVSIQYLRMESMAGERNLISSVKIEMKI